MSFLTKYLVKYRVFRDLKTKRQFDYQRENASVCEKNMEELVSEIGNELQVLGPR